MYRVSEGIRSTHGQEGAIVLDIRQGQMFNLNFVGSRILQLLNAGTNDEAIVDTISQEFSVCRESVEGDIQEFLRDLEAFRLVETGFHHDLTSE
jgi:Coenzyme PQQ synthesis protein D (PqqD)